MPLTNTCHTNLTSNKHLHKHTKYTHLPHSPIKFVRLGATDAVLSCYSATCSVIMSCHTARLAQFCATTPSRLARGWPGDSRSPVNDNGPGLGARHSSVLQTTTGPASCSDGTCYVACKMVIPHRPWHIRQMYDIVWLRQFLLSSSPHVYQVHGDSNLFEPIGITVLWEIWSHALPKRL